MTEEQNHEHHAAHTENAHHEHNEHHEHKEHHEHAEHKEHHEHAEHHAHKAQEAPKQDEGKIMGFEQGALITAVAFLFAGIVLGALLAYGMGALNSPTTTIGQNVFTGASVDQNALKQNVEKYINTNLLTDKTVSAKILDSNDLGNGLFALSFEIYQDGAVVSSGQVYANEKEIIIGQLFSMSAPVDQPEPVKTEYTKSDKPKVTLFVMAFCPYGLQAVKAFGPAMQLLGPTTDTKMGYVLYSNFASQYGADWNAYCFDENETYCSMHGAGELNEDIRQLCIQKDQPDKLWNYLDAVVADYDAGKVSAANIDSKWKDYAKVAGVDTAKVESCIANDAATLLAEQAALNKQFSVQGSPTAIINGAQYAGGRTAEEFKTAVCQAFNTAPADCSAALNSTASSAPAGGCATPTAN
ncbi:MAG: thioredoxin domain-containing protein [archaeon]